MMKKLAAILIASMLIVPMCACDIQATRQEAKTILKDVLRALPGGLKEAKEKIVDPTIDTIKEDAKEIYDDVKPSWDEAFSD